MIPVRDERPLPGAIIAEPVVLYLSLLLTGTNKRGRGSFARFVQAVGLNQKQLAISEPKKGLSTLGVGTAAQHFRTTSCPPGTRPGERLNFEWLALAPPQNSTAHYQRGYRRRFRFEHSWCGICRFIGNYDDGPSKHFPPRFVRQGTNSLIPRLSRVHQIISIPLIRKTLTRWENPQCAE